MTRLSLLIPSLAARQDELIRLQAELTRQIDRDALPGEVEVLSLVDNGREPVGHKRNQLLAQASGEYVAFIDDDDWISQRYVKQICTSLRDHAHVDCLGIRGVVYFNGEHAHLFVHSRQYRHYFKKGHVYYRPPYHLNPVKREIAVKFPFPALNFSEDIDWAMRLSRAGALKTEWFIADVLYHYFSRRPWPLQWCIDATEAVRRPLGLEVANRIRLQRWFRRVCTREPGKGVE